MAENEQTNRRLAAILAADVVGYSRMMGADEAGTLTTLKRHRETVFDPAVAAHKGRVVKLIGDGTLVEFASVVDAVKCALAIQRAVKAASAAGRTSCSGSASISATSSSTAKTSMATASTSRRVWSRWPSPAASASPRSSTRASATAST